MTLPLDFYLRDDVVQIGKDLLGKFLFTKIDGQITGGQIIETEAYRGTEDRACHAYNGRRTKRTAPLYENGGITYVYLCYGIHYLLNVVTNEKEIPHAVLIRAIEPTVGIPFMLKRRNKETVDKTLTSGPGSLSCALGIDFGLNQTSLMGSKIWIEDGPSPKKIVSSPRIGVEYAKEDATLPWRFTLG